MDLKAIGNWSEPRADAADLTAGKRKVASLQVQDYKVGSRLLCEQHGKKPEYRYDQTELGPHFNFLPEQHRQKIKVQSSNTSFQLSAQVEFQYRSGHKPTGYNVSL